MALTLDPNIKNLAAPLLVNSELKTLPLNQTLSEFTRSGGLGGEERFRLGRSRLPANAPANYYLSAKIKVQKTLAPQPPLPKNPDDVCYQWLAPMSEFSGRGGAKILFLCTLLESKSKCHWDSASPLTETQTNATKNANRNQTNACTQPPASQSAARSDCTKLQTVDDLRVYID